MATLTRYDDLLVLTVGYRLAPKKRLLEGWRIREDLLLGERKVQELRQREVVQAASEGALDQRKAKIVNVIQRAASRAALVENATVDGSLELRLMKLVKPLIGSQI